MIRLPPNSWFPFLQALSAPHCGVSYGIDDLKVVFLLSSYLSTITHSYDYLSMKKTIRIFFRMQEWHEIQERSYKDLYERNALEVF